MSIPIQRQNARNAQNRRDQPAFHQPGRARQRTTFPNAPRGTPFGWGCPCAPFKEHDGQG
ncbi:MAG: hypothetical protein HN849_24635 [Victivallales bacterium]|nr:hypothetical protein [Victivallales bacterium]